MKKVYIIGIGGAGTSALAMIYKKRGFDVCGSDDGDGFYTDELQKDGIKIYDEYASEHITDDIDLVVHVSAINQNNIELVRARELSLEIISYAEAIARLTKELNTIAVCGTHGKTTTTALIAHAFIELNLDPTVIVGSKISAWGSGAHAGKSKYFIIEADEYLNKLALYNPQSVILTSVDFDHPDFFEDFVAYKKVFSNFIAKIPESGFLVACGDDSDVREVALSANAQVFFYGEGELNNCRIVSRDTNKNGQEIKIKFRDEEFIVKTQLFGAHNAKNAVAAWLMTFLVFTDQKQQDAQDLSDQSLAISDGINTCVGTARRFERKGELQEAVLIDDYAHHPEEIEATLKAVREVFPNKKIIAAFHPHTFSRTEALLDEFAQALSKADEVIVLDIFASAREEQGNITAQDLVDKVDCKEKQNIHTIDELAKWMKNNLTKDDVFITLGAGDIYQVYNLL